MADLPLLLFLIVCGYSLWRLLGWTKSFRKRFYAERFGEAGEARSQRIINSTFDPNIYHRFHNLIIPTDNGTTQVDHLLISSFGLFIIETKAMVGWIFGTESQASWTKINYQNRLSFQNPLKQNYRHIKCLSDYLKIKIGINIPIRKFHSVIFFVGDGAKLKVEMPSNVIVREYELGRHIKSFKKKLIAGPQLDLIINCIQELKDDPSLDHDVHMESLYIRHNSPAKCPRCGGMLRERKARGSSFLGCSNYPRCRFTRKS